MKEISQTLFVRLLPESDTITITFTMKEQHVNIVENILICNHSMRRDLFVFIRFIYKKSTDHAEIITPYSFVDRIQL